MIMTAAVNISRMEDFTFDASDDLHPYSPKVEIDGRTASKWSVLLNDALGHEGVIGSHNWVVLEAVVSSLRRMFVSEVESIIRGFSGFLHRRALPRPQASSPTPY